MEGPNLRSASRTSLCCPVELRVGKHAIQVVPAVGDLSVRGLFVNAEGLPVDTAVHIRMTAGPALEAEGVVRFSQAESIGIEFTALTEANRRRLEQRIAEFVEKETLGPAQGNRICSRRVRL